MTINVGGSPEGKASALGASVTLRACGKSRVKRIGGSSSLYSQSLNTHLHFGLGRCKENVTVTAHWTDGGSRRLTFKEVKTEQDIGVIAKKSYKG